ncbi:GMC family oxidoreductase [Variovorax sp. Sphag1AA]|uniref:GMC family oxidoreductase n=1 Tax=Variovorax sp. Sphag1AA TaxID=2587027 RepID=UPI0016148CB5|nr:GMC family oxidoreductase N-terminal domain-containing protein [Variovorax sp. Sphag1AA]MBB3181059.1 choline dehydrogenase [Variovorax sp. Sphag1AA]
MQKYDYIIIGAGSAGCAVARRLSDDPAVRVLLLEAGPPANEFWIRTPAGMAKLFKNKRYNWGYFTEPVPTLHDRRVYFPRGKALGGSGAINGMVYVRGNSRDFDQWRDLGNQGWGWDDVLPYFKRLENYGALASPLLGNNGPLTVSEPVVKHPTAVDFIEAARRIGVPHVEMPNGTEPESVGFLPASIRDGIRQSAYDSYIAPVRSRPNLVVESDVHVRRVILENGQATGVEVLQGGQVRTIGAGREVVISAGALNSPQVLMLSGIGDGEALHAHAIETLVDLPGVGKNLQDHFVARVQARSTPESSYNRALAGWRKYAEGARYVATKSGYLALASSMAAAFVRSSPEAEYADLEISFRPMTFTHHPNGKVDIDDIDAVSASVYNTRPASRGEVRLRSRDPLEAPAFVPNFLAEPADVRAMISGLRKIRAILASQPLAARVLEELTPGPAADTDDQLLDYLRREGNCAFHPAGSCKMGNDPMAVVDERLRVRGVKRLRVADASIMPTVTAGNTNAPSIMIGEKAADLIRADAKKI